MRKALARCHLCFCQITMRFECAIHLQATIERTRYGDAFGFRLAIASDSDDERIQLITLVLELLDKTFYRLFAEVLIMSLHEVT